MHVCVFSITSRICFVRSPKCKGDKVMDNEDAPTDERDHCKGVHFSTSCDAYNKCMDSRKWMWLVACDNALD